MHTLGRRGGDGDVRPLLRRTWPTTGWRSSSRSCSGADAAALPGTVTLHATDTGGSWPVAGRTAGRAHRRAEVTGTASDLVLMLYRRLPVADCIVDGDPLLVASLLSLADTS